MRIVNLFYWKRWTIKCHFKLRTEDSAKPVDDLDTVKAANELVEAMKINGPAWTDNPLGKQIVTGVAQINLQRLKQGSDKLLAFFP